MIEKPIYSKYDDKGEEETTIEIGFDEKLVGFRIQLSDWVDCKIAKISFKIAKCIQQGFDYSSVKEHVQEKKEQKILEEIKVKQLLNKYDFNNNDQIW